MWSSIFRSTFTCKHLCTTTDVHASFLSQLTRGLVLFFLFAGSHFCTAEIFFSSRTIGPSTNIYSVDAEGAIKKITDNTAWQDTEACLSETGDIVFMSNRKDKLTVNLNKNSEDFNIFKLALDSGQIQQISFAPELEHSPVISADGRWIAYIQKTGEFRKLMLLKNGETTPKTLLIADDIRGFSWSPNNRILSFASLNGQISRLVLFDVVSNEKLTLLELHTAKNSISETTNATAKFNKLLSDKHAHRGNIISSAQWSPDGHKIAYILASSENNSRELYVLNLWSSQNILVSNNEVQVQHPVSWSPDSKKVLYSALLDFNFYFDEKIYKKVYEGSMQVYLADMQGTIQQITEGEYLHNHPVFSPDGSQIAFLYGNNLGERTLALHTLSLKNGKRREYYDRVAGDSYLFWR